MSRSYPYLAIAKRYELNYSDVLLYAEWLMSGQRLAEVRFPVRDAVERLKRDVNELICRDFVISVKEAIANFRKVQREGW